MVAVGNWDNIKVPIGATLLWLSLLITLLNIEDSDQAASGS